MFAKRLKLENFRRFDALDLSFAKRLNVIVGVNGAGKSTILGALAKMLSWYVRRLVSPSGTGVGVPILEPEVKTGAARASVAVSVSDGVKDFAWTLQKNVKGAPVLSAKSDLRALNDYVKEIRESFQGDIRSVPIIVSYGVNRSVVDIPLRIRKRHQFFVLSAYDDIFERSADFRRFFEWFRVNEDVENERIADGVEQGTGREGRRGLNRELSAVRRALSVFLPEFSRWRIRRTPLRMEVLKDGQSLNVEQLSDGEKCVIALVGDLARRLVMANPDLDDPLVGGGIALIDEVELHLHPAWQSTILPRLLETFPNVQFVVTTHSPIVLAQLNNLLYGHKDAGIAVFSLQDGQASSLIDPETGLLVSGEMDEVVQSIDAEFDALLGGGGDEV